MLILPAINLSFTDLVGMVVYRTEFIGRGLIGPRPDPILASLENVSCETADEPTGVATANFLALADYVMQFRLTDRKPVRVGST